MWPIKMKIGRLTGRKMFLGHTGRSLKLVQNFVILFDDIKEKDTSRNALSWRCFRGEFLNIFRKKTIITITIKHIFPRTNCKLQQLLEYKSFKYPK